METPSRWLAQNQRYLMARISSVRGDLRRYAAGTGATLPGPEFVPASPQAVAEAAAALTAPAALETLAGRLALSAFERDVLLLCCGVELDHGFAADCAAAAGGATTPTFGLALAALREAHWSALLPTAPLRRFGLIEVGSGATLIQAPLRIAERVLHFLTGLSYPDPQLGGVLTRVAGPELMSPSLSSLARTLAGLLRDQRGPSASDRGWRLNLYGEDLTAQLAVATAAARALGLCLLKLDLADLPASPSERADLATLCARECVLDGALLALMGEADGDGTQRQAALGFTRAYQEPILVLGSAGSQPSSAEDLRLHVPKPSDAEQRQLLHAALGEYAPRAWTAIERAVAHYQLDLAAIKTLGRCVCDSLAQQADADPGEVLWERCQDQARGGWDRLAQRIVSAAGWDDLVLPDSLLQTLRAIAGQLRHREQVYGAWNMGRPGPRGLGITALFAGKSGTGKTLAAEVLANELRLDLYRIDLSQVISKYIGETEKNLRRVFAAAERGGAILLFDEADALFGRRSEVRDSHDRYANIEVSYLLQAMESYRGLAILTSNLGRTIDEAFLRRLRFVVEFPFPDAAARLQLWRRAIHPDVPSQGIDLSKLARLTVAGGNIRTIALNAAFLAADASEPLRMPHLMQAARSELAKLGKPLNEADLLGGN